MRRSGWAAAAGAVGFVCGAGCAAPAVGQDLTFDAAARRLQTHNERQLAAEAGVSRARAERRQALGRHLPELNMTARSTRLDEGLVIDLDPVRQVLLQLHPQVPSSAVPPFAMAVQGSTFHNATLTATLPVFVGGRLLAGDRAAGAAVQSAQAQALRVSGELMTELAQRYFGLQLAQEARLTRERTVRTVAQHVERARSLERNGQVSRAERLRAEVALAEARREHSQSVRDEQLAQLALASTLSMAGEVRATTPLLRVTRVPPLDSLLGAAAHGNAALQQLSAERERSRQGVRAAAGELAPTVGLFASRELYTRDLTLLQPEWAVGVQVSMPLFHGGQRFARVAAARSLEREIDLRLERARRDVQLQVEKRRAELLEAGDQLTALESTRELAEESLRAQQSAFAAGLATSLDVLDAEQALARVDLGIMKARFDGAVALAGLLEAVGASEQLPRLISELTEGGR
jgi:outer membrane protein TolC